MKNIITLLLLFGLVGCSSHPLSQGHAFRLKKVSFSDLPGWGTDVNDAYPALEKACRTPTSEWMDFCDSLTSYQYASSRKFKTFLERNLTPYQVISYGKTTGKITGYYETELTGTREKTADYQVPVYGLPYDYDKDEKGPTRSDIESDDDFDAPIIAWADSAIDLFVLHVQGSGRMTTPDGIIQLGFAGSNNHRFKGLGNILEKEGLLQETGHSMPQIYDWLVNNPDRVDDILTQNDRYIYFREIHGETPIGTAGVALTPYHSVAVDRNYIPMQTPMWLVTTDPDNEPIEVLVVAQDTGNAIRGGIRADYFFGHGNEAFHIAGRMNQEGQYFLLLPD